MAKILSELMGVPLPLFEATVGALEKASSCQSEDVRLSAEILARSRVAMRALGLDPQDTNGPELYHALQDMVRLHDDFLVRHIGGTDPGNVSDLLPRIVAVAERTRIPRRVWALKHSVAKRLLKHQPPKRVMKALGYRSLDSLLKRESMGIVFACMRLVESEAWQDNFIKQYKKLTPSDFETRPVEIAYGSGAKWERLSSQFTPRIHQNITHSKEMGAILVIPLPVAKLPGITVAALPLLLHYIGELRVYSTLFKLNQMKPDFGEFVYTTIRHDPMNHAQIAGQDVHWRAIHKHFGSRPKLMHPELFEPHVQPEDLEWRYAEEVLMRLEPALQFWHGLDFVGVMHDDRPISLNLIDVATNYINQIPYGQHISTHMRSSLSNELVMRYLRHPAIEAQVLAQLDTDNTMHEAVDLQELFV